MALLQSLWLLTVILVHYFIFSPDAEKAFVSPSQNVTCSAQPCLRLNDYAREVNQYFLDNTTFMFLSGVHQLNIYLRLENISNVAFFALNETQGDTVKVFLSPLVNITWSDCNNIVINGLVFVLSGDSTAGTFFSAIAFQRTTSFLSQLILFGNGTMQSTAIWTHSSQVEISDVMVLGATSIYGAALVAFNSTIHFFGYNIFINNTAAQGGAMVFIQCVSSFSGNVSFINNTAISDARYMYSQGGAIYCSNSVLSFSGTALFQHNQATTLADSILVNVAKGGALQALSGSSLTFKATSNASFIENTAIFQGGAVSVSTSEVSIQGRTLFVGNVAGQNGGAIGGDSNSRIYCSGMTIKFQNNSVVAMGGIGGGIGGASNVELEETQFEKNAAGTGGAINCYKGSYLHISTCEFVNNTAFYSAGAVRTGSGTAVIFGGINHFEGNRAPIAGAVDAYNTCLLYTSPSPRDATLSRMPSSA